MKEVVTWVWDTGAAACCDVCGARMQMSAPPERWDRTPLEPVWAFQHAHERYCKPEGLRHHSSKPTIFDRYANRLEVSL